MKLYHYVACTLSGEKINGEQLASDELEIQKWLTQKNLFLISAKSVESRVYQFRDKNLDNLIFFSQYYDALISIGIPLDEGLTIISEETADKRFKKVLLEIRERIQSGQKVSDSFAYASEYFNQIFIDAIKFGEYSGNIGIALSKTLKVFIQENELRKKVGQSIFKLKLIGFALFVSSVLFFRFTATAIEKLSISLGPRHRKMPHVMQSIIDFNHFLDNNVMGIGIGFLILISLLYFFRQSKMIVGVSDFLSTYTPVYWRITLSLNDLSVSAKMAYLLERGVKTQDALGSILDSTTSKPHLHAHISFILDKLTHVPLVATRKYGFRGLSQALSRFLIADIPTSRRIQILSTVEELAVTTCASAIERWTNLIDVVFHFVAFIAVLALVVLAMETYFSAVTLPL